MAKTFIVIEGDDDQNFLTQLVSRHFENSEIVFIKVDTNGSSLSREAIENIRLETIGLAEKTLFILDADAPNYSKTKSNLIESISAIGEIDDENIFLFPNDQDGCLEDLLNQLIPDNYQHFFSGCITHYAECVNELEADLEVNKKDRLFIYTASLTRNNNFSSGSKRNYNSEFWNLDSEALNPLLVFLRNHLQNEA